MQYINTGRRWNWGGYLGYVPFLTGGIAQGIDQGGNLVQQLIQQRFITAQGQLFAQYPLSRVRRFELSGGVSQTTINATVFTSSFGGQSRERFTFQRSAFANLGAAFVGDYSIFGFTSPIAGGRYRFAVSPASGNFRLYANQFTGLQQPVSANVQFTNVTADYRRYWLARPVTFAIRGMHLGRYNSPRTDSLLGPYSGNYIGNPFFIRGYDVFQNFDPNTECRGVPNAQSFFDCPVFARTLGSRSAVFNAELRIPLFGAEGLGIFRTSIAPVEIAPFFDGGLAWNAGDPVRLRLLAGDAARQSIERIPVFSAGLTTRINLLGFAVVEAFYAVPFQRPDRGGRFGFQLLPGW
jgi:hypothetical protein